MLLKQETSVEFATPWEGDALERQKIANYLTPIIGSIRQSFVIGLNSEYGTGKTFFIRHWQQDLTAQGYKALYFNAWETDYAQDAFIAFIGTIKSQLKDPQKKLAKDIAKLVKESSVYATRKILPIVAKAAARKAIGEKAIEELVNLSEKTDDDVANFFGEVAEESLRKYEMIGASISAFKKQLEAVVQKLSKDVDSDDKKKIIIFVDELDRCRPTYAIEVLECIKHLFNVPGVVFVLAIDDKQLKGAIASVYGSKIDGEGYLKKFIDWQLNLPQPSALKYAAYLYDSFGLKETGCFKNRGFRGDDRKELISSFGVFAQSFDLSLREQAQCFTEINLVMRSTPQHLDPEAYLVAIISVLKLKCKTQLDDCLFGRSNPEQFADFIGKKLDMELYAIANGWEWKEEKKIIHALFTNDHFRRLLDTELNGFSGRPLDDAELKRHQYISRVIELHQSFRQGRARYQTPAERVYKSFNKASELVKSL